ncbi:PREDICTED: acetylcholine receptor subunit beta-like 1 [Priapulus caudatus]|uniref:Acetylcholine receptor subunit beta-like 1 n=1 Tax=Priapulus caudatus TaxID=37621 RepID=A0ABM1F9G6_PRICU|nr:PREDICTED: acetylcholine receptor subunit beta-like 1 [Priapulus caudatus]
MRVGYALLTVVIVVLHLPRTDQLLSGGLGSEDEERLLRRLFRGYNKLIRPVQNMTDVLEVQFGMALIQLINVDEKNQILKTNVWLRYIWTDYQLSWEPSEYAGIAQIRIPSQKVWIPDIVLFNNADGNYEVSYKVNVVLFHTGQVLWVPPAIYQSSCTIDVTYFPFDKQECNMKFGSWTFNAEQVRLKFYEGTSSVDLNDYVISGTWDVLEVPGDLSEDNSTIEFLIKLRRKTLFYTVNLVIPCVLLSFLSILVFYLPSDCGEKMTLAISLLLALVVFLLLVSKILPPTSLTIPLVSKYLLFTFIMNIVTILATVIIINWNFRGPTTHRMPRLLRCIFIDFFPKVLLIRRPPKKLRTGHQHPGHQQHRHPDVEHVVGGVGAESATHYGNTVNTRDDVKYSYISKADVMELSEMHHPNCKLGGRQSSSEMRAEEDGQEVEYEEPIPLTAEAHRTATAVDFIAEHLRMEDEVAVVKEDWQYIAMVIDRLLLYIFFAVTASGTLGLILKAPYIFDYVDQEEVMKRLRGEET